MVTVKSVHIAEFESDSNAHIRVGKYAALQCGTNLFPKFSFERRIGRLWTTQLRQLKEIHGFDRTQGGCVRREWGGEVHIAQCKFGEL